MRLVLRLPRPVRAALCACLAALAVGAAPVPAPASSPPAAAPAAPDSTHRAPRVPWEQGLSWSEIVATAGARRSPILIDFTAAWCGPCRLLDVMVFTEKPVIERLADVLTVKVDIDHPGPDDLPGRFGVEVVPTLVWCGADGVERDRITGYQSSVEFLATLETWRAGTTLDEVLAARLAHRPEDASSLLDLARRQERRGAPRDAETMYRRLLNLRRSAEPRLVAEGLLGLARLRRDAGREAESRDLTARASAVLTARVGSRADVQEVLPGLMAVADFQRDEGDTLGALDTWRAMRDVDGRNPAVLEGYARAALAADRDLEEATNAALRAMVYSDENAAAIGVLAECYRRRGLYDRALKWIDQSIERAPDDARYRDQRAAILADQAAGRR